jgi:hypothetical protein
LGEKPTRCEAGKESYGSYKTTGLPIEQFFIKNNQKEEKLMQVKSLIINFIYFFHIPPVSNHSTHYSLQPPMIKL